MLRFLWLVSRDHPFRPWLSRYLLWRIETYWGWHADQISPSQFRAFVWEHRAELWRFLRWAGRMRSSG